MSRKSNGLGVGQMIHQFFQSVIFQTVIILLWVILIGQIIVYVLTCIPGWNIRVYCLMSGLKNYRVFRTHQFNKPQPGYKTFYVCERCKIGVFPPEKDGSVPVLERSGRSVRLQNKNWETCEIEQINQILDD